MFVILTQPNCNREKRSVIFHQTNLQLKYLCHLLVDMRTLRIMKNTFYFVLFINILLMIVICTMYIYEVYHSYGLMVTSRKCFSPNSQGIFKRVKFIILEKMLTTRRYEMGIWWVNNNNNGVYTL